MAELAEALFRGDSWHFPGIQATEILHTKSEDCSTDSPVHAKVEEQSTFRAASDANKVTAIKSLHDSSTLQEQLVSAEHRVTNDTEEVAKGLTAVAHAAFNTTFSSSSNSSNCAVPSPGPQSPTSYDIKASAHLAEQLPNRSALYPHASQSQPRQTSPGATLSAAGQVHLHQLMARVFSDVDSGRAHHMSCSNGHVPHSAYSQPLPAIQHSGTFPPQMGLYFPAVDQLPSQSQMQLQTQLQTQLLAQQLLEQQQQEEDEQPHRHQQPGAGQQRFTAPNAAHRTAFAKLSRRSRGLAPAQIQQAAQDFASQQPAHQRQAKQRRTSKHAQHQPEDVDLSVLKRDFSSFSNPESQGRLGRQATRRAKSFTHGSAASVTTVNPASTARQSRGAASSSQAASRMASPMASAASLPDSDVSLSDEGQSEAEDPETGSKRQRVVKGRRGARIGRRMLCKNCGAHQTPQWRCGPAGPRTLCNACGVRYKKGLPLNGPNRAADL